MTEKRRRGKKKWGDKKGAHIGGRADQTQLPWQQMEADAGMQGQLEVKKKKERGVGCLVIKYAVFESPQKDVNVNPSPNLWNIPSSQVVRHTCTEETLKAEQQRDQQ